MKSTLTNTSLDYDIDMLTKHMPSSLIGADEVGRGALAGPILACAVRVDPSNLMLLFDKVRDSKKLTEARRDELFDDLSLLSHSFEQRSPDDVDAYGIDAANKACLLGAILAEKSRAGRPCVGLADGRAFSPSDVARAGLPLFQVDKGESVSATIAAASILAKVTRDRLMLQLDAMYPAYGFAAHKGYGTPQHYKALRELGPIAGVHRVTFLPKQA